MDLAMFQLWTHHFPKGWSIIINSLHPDITGSFRPAKLVGGLPAAASGDVDTAYLAQISQQQETGDLKRNYDNQRVDWR